jgi:poly(3-hydroxybutyrate) depolymerase
LLESEASGDSHTAPVEVEAPGTARHAEAAATRPPGGPDAGESLRNAALAGTSSQSAPGSQSFSTPDDTPLEVVAVEPIDPPVPTDCVSDVAPGLHTVTCGGEVTFTYHVPDICTRLSCGLIVDVHGFCMNGNQLDANTNMRALGARHGFLVVQPTGPGGLIPEWTGSQDPEIHAFVDRMVAAFDVNERRIHVAGYSQGGSMTWRFICENQTRYASFAPSSSGPGCPNFPDPGYECLQNGQGVPDRQAPVLYQHGRFDVRAPFACAEQNRDELVRGWGLSLAEVVSEGALHSRTRYTSETGSVLEFVEHGYRAQGDLITATQVDGHCIPGGEQSSPWPETLCPVYLACDGEQAYRWGEEVIDFFIRHPKAHASPAAPE